MIAVSVEPAHAGSIERGHDRVVQREADDEEVERGERAPPDDDCADGEEQRVDAELDNRHGARVQRAEVTLPPA